MVEYTQLSFSTADDEANYFTGEKRALPTSKSSVSVLPPGVYRVIDGNLTKIVFYRACVQRNGVSHG